MKSIGKTFGRYGGSGVVVAMAIRAVAPRRYSSAMGVPVED